MQRYFGKEKINNKIILKEEDYHHIKDVIRHKEKDKVIINIDNKSYICELNKDLLSVTILEEVKSIDNLNVILYVPILSDNKMSLIIEKATELGVKEIIPIELEKCKFLIPKQKQNKKIERFKKLALSSSMQCGRVNVPIIRDITNISTIKKEKVNILCSIDESDVKSIKDVLKSYNSCDIIQIVFGPEGGLTIDEEKTLVKKGFTKTSLGSRILRTETVPMYVLSVINYVLEKE